jgi:hypothetical protein
MVSKRSPTAEAVSRTITEFERKYATEDPKLVDKIRRRALLRLSDRLIAALPRTRVIKE